MKSLSDAEIYEKCLELFPDYYDGKASVYEDKVCCGHKCKKEAVGNCFVGSGLMIIVFSACAEHMKMHGKVIEGLSLNSSATQE